MYIAFFLKKLIFTFHSPFLANFVGARYPTVRLWPIPAPHLSAQKPTDFCLQDFDKFRLHVLIVIRDIQTDDPLPFKNGRNFVERPFRWAFSITNMMLAHAICSDDSGTVASPPKPAESVSTSGQPANISSAVGLLRRF
jgi:hypothetical protein